MSAKETQFCYLNRKYNLFDFNLDVDNERLYCLELENVPVSLVNAIRRIGMNEINTYAFDKFNVIKNTSQYDSEVLSQRFEFITVNANEANNINIMTDFVISKTNNSNKQILVYLYDAISSSDINIKKLFPHNMLLFTLLPNEEIYAKSTIIKGIGNTHAKFAAGRISTKFKTENDTVESLLPETNIDKMNYIKNEIDGSPKAFLLNFESFSKIDAKDIYLLSISKLIEKLKNIKQRIINDDDFIIKENNNIKLLFNNENHTIGYLLETFTLKQIIEDNEYTNIYCFYNKPYPNEEYIEFTLKLNTDINAIDYLIKIIDNAIVLIDSLTSFTKQ
jgi:hypothetical protein